MRITPTPLFALAALLATTACSTSQPEPAPAPSPPVAPTPTPTPAPAPASGAWTEWPLQPGTWVYREDDRGSIALFGPAQSDALFTIRCDRSRRQIFISRAGQAPAGGAAMTLRASSGLQSYTGRSTGASAPYYTAVAMSPTEFMLDRIAFSRGRFALETAGMASVAIPIWPEFTRVVEDCRS